MDPPKGFVIVAEPAAALPAWNWRGDGAAAEPNEAQVVVVLAPVEEVKGLWGF